jgi:TolA-binding protein
MATKSGNHRAAERFFAIYQRESPRGKRAADALGRQMVALAKLGRLGLARTKARAYLRAYPKGTYARVARSLIGR